MQPTVSLDRLQVGQLGQVVTVAGEDSTSLRLLELGVLPGETVEVLGFAPWGGPMAVRVHGARIALRRSDAAKIQVSLSRTAAAAVVVPAPLAAVAVTP